jgi:hypothetical protein
LRAVAFPVRPGQPYPAPVRVWLVGAQGPPDGSEPQSAGLLFVSAPDGRRAPTNRVDPPGVEPGLPACHTGVIPPRPQARQWNGGESNPDLLFARQAPEPPRPRVPFTDSGTAGSRTPLPHMRSAALARERSRQ